MPATNRRLDHIDALRGLAALAVCWFHLTRGGKLLPEGWVASLSAYGFLGVEVFFVISGFVIPWAMWRADYRISDFWHFLGKRMVRLYPPYLLALLLIVFLNYASSRLPVFHGSFHPLTAFKELLTESIYLNGILDRSWSIMVVAWTLAIEIQFYLLAGILAAWLRFDRGPMTLIGLLLLVSSAYWARSNHYIFAYLPFFVLGWSGAWIHAGGIKKMYPWMLSAWSLVLMIMTQSLAATIVAMMTFLVIVFWNYRVPGVLIWLGSISYSLYLLHVPIGGKVMNLAERYGTHSWVMPLALAVALSICLISAWCYWRWIELPFHQLSRSLFRKLKQKTV